MATILYASHNRQEREALRSDAGMADFTIRFAESMSDVESAVVSEPIQAILTDLNFADGDLVDWLMLWSYPHVLIVDWGDHEKLSSLATSQISDFVVRDETMHHVQALPHVIRKVLRNRESLERHNIDLKLNEHRYHELVQALPDIVYVLDETSHFVFVNNSVRTLGWEPSELVGKHFGVLLGEGEAERVGREHVLKRYTGTETGSSGAPKLFDERRSGARRTSDLEVRLRHRTRPDRPDELETGTVISFGEINAVGLEEFGLSTGSPGTVGIIRDITSHHEERERLATGLLAKEAMLAEVHHRIKNNLQVVSSLLNLQSNGRSDPIMAGTQAQIQAMALVHEHLYQNASIGELNLGAYLDDLVVAITEIYQVDPARVAVRVVSEDVVIPMGAAMPAALIVNELVTNAVKHAFPDGASGTILTEVGRMPDGVVRIVVSDNGIGVSADIASQRPEALGFQLLTSLTEQIGATFTIEPGDGKGTLCTVLYTPPA